MNPLVRPARIAAGLGLVAIVVLSLVPGGWRPSTGNPKAIEHFIAYTLVAAVVTMACRARWRHILLMIVLAGALEFCQVWIPGRDSNPVDFLGSCAGALLGFALCSLVRALVPRLASMRIGDGSTARSANSLSQFVVPAVAATALVAVSMAVAPGAAGWFGAGLALLMLAIAVVDGQRFLIPDSLNAAALTLGIVRCVVLGQGAAALADAALRTASLALLFLILRLMYERLRGRQGIGLGDVKLAGVAGAWLGWSILPIAVEIAALSALCVYALRRYILRRPLRSTSRVPFGLYFAPAIWIGWLLQTMVPAAW
jgi:leader peptidase (prepilin peptidase)/N-methyltransferase